MHNNTICITIYAIQLNIRGFIMKCFVLIIFFLLVLTGCDNSNKDNDILYNDPIAVLYGEPGKKTNCTYIDITVGGIDIVEYRHRIDNEIWGNITGIDIPIIEYGFPEGLHTIEVIGGDIYGNWQRKADATVWTWEVDLNPPVAELSGLPPDPTDDTTVSITVGGNDVVSYKYNLDGTGWNNETGIAIKISLNDLSFDIHTIAVIAKDFAGNWQDTSFATTYTWKVVNALPPIPGNSGTITVSDIGSTSVTLFWTKANDSKTQQSDLLYRVYISESENIDTVENIKDNGIPVDDWETDIESKLVDDLDPCTTYYFNLLVKNNDDIESAYTMVSAETTAPVSPEFSPSGSYTISPIVSYSCALDMVVLYYDALTFIDNGTTLIVEPLMDNGCYLTGVSAADGFINVSCIYPGGCDETFSLEGCFTDDDTWEGALTVTFSGICFDCSNMQWNITGTRQD